MAEGFLLPEGISIEDVSGLRNAYSEGEEGCVSAVLSAEKLYGFIEGFVALLKEPAFFFIELPCIDEKGSKPSKDERMSYKLYYLDNCTEPVIRALWKEYASLLINDGLCRFGFGGNESGDEIYVQTYKVMSIYCSSAEAYDKTIALLKGCGAEKQQQLVTPWEVITPENPGVCAITEEDGLTLFDLPEMLSNAGMYYSDTVE